MGIFGQILSKIFPSNHPAVNAAPAVAAASTNESGSHNASSSEAGAPSSSAPHAQPTVDVVSVLNGLAEKHPAEKLNWRTSIVDLMKLVGLDSSLAARRSLAQELGFRGDTNDSGSMNVWLHKEVMRKISENGGKVPAELKT